MMNRRKFIKEGVVKVGLISIGPGILFSVSCSNPETLAFNEKFSQADVDLLNELGEVIIPSTDIPGGKAARVGEYIALIVQDCYSDPESEEFSGHLKSINDFSHQKYGRSFLDCNEDQRIQLVSEMEIDHTGYGRIKSMIVSSYLSSEIGRTQLFAYHPVPGRYDGCTSDIPW